MLKIIEDHKGNAFAIPVTLVEEFEILVDKFRDGAEDLLEIESYHEYYMIEGKCESCGQSLGKGGTPNVQTNQRST